VRLLAVSVLAAAILLDGCGGVTAADLFLLERTGSGPGQHLVLLVNEEGLAHCNGGKPLRISDPQLVQARAISEELAPLASSATSLPPRPGSVLSYSVRVESGTVHFSDNSLAQPRVLRNLALFVLQVAQQVCGLPE